MVNEFKPSEKIPTILMFQPTRFEIVEGDRIKEWEEHMREHVGLDAKVEMLRSGLPSISFCPYADDCDEV